MVKVTLEFPSVDVAIVALAKFVGGKAARAAEPLQEVSGVSAGATGAVSGASAPPLAAALPGASPAKRTRKPRADKGQPRGEYAPRNASSEALAGATGPVSGAPAPGLTAAPSGDTENAAPGTYSSGTEVAPTNPGSPASAVPTPEEAQAALEAVFNGKGLAIAQECLGRYGVNRLKMLSPEHRADFIKLCKESV